MAAGPGHAQDFTLLNIAVAGGVLAVPIAFLSYPALVALGCVWLRGEILVPVAKSARRGRDPAALGAACAAQPQAVRRPYSPSFAAGRRWTGTRSAPPASSRSSSRPAAAGSGRPARAAPSPTSPSSSPPISRPRPPNLIGKNFIDLIGIDDRRGSESSERTLGFHLSTRLPFTDINVRANTTAEIWWSLSGTPSFDEYGRFLGFRGIGTDLTQQRRSEEEINRLAKYDSLTNLPNRMLMRRTLDETLQKKGDAAGGGCALFLIDLDRFKNVNDTLGHPVGDALLKQVAQRLTTVIGKIGQVGRLGGDEFEAVLPGQARRRCTRRSRRTG